MSLQPKIVSSEIVPNEIVPSEIVPNEIASSEIQTQVYSPEEVFRKSTCEVLDQLIVLISSSVSVYTHKSKISGSNIGRHVRHITDHFFALQVATNSGHLDYNQRDRDSEVETNVEFAIEKIKHIITWIQQTELTDQELSVETEISVSEYQNVVLTSGLHRELCYVINHSIHHIAYAKLIATKLGANIDETIGLAPATATYQRDS